MVGLLLIALAGAEPTSKGLEPYAPAGATQRADGRRYAVVFGTDSYDDSTFHDLRYAGADARSVAAALLDWDEVTLLVTPEQTTLASMREAVDALRDKALRPNDTVVVYVSGHGTLGRPPGGELERFVVPSDAKAGRIDSTGLSVADLVATVEALPALRKGVILATCYNGREKSAWSSSLAAELANTKGTAPPLLARSEAMIVTSAASWGEAALEDEGLGHDVYTYYLLQALRDGDRDHNGAITLTEAHDYARERTFAHTGGAQRPSAKAVVLGADPIVLAGDPAGIAAPLLYSYDDASDGLTLVFDGTPKGTLPAAVPVEPGVHSIELHDPRGRVLASERVSVAPGQRYSISELVVPRARVSVQLGGVGWTPLSGEGWASAAGAAMAVQLAPARSPLRLHAGAWAGGGLGLDLKRLGGGELGAGLDVLSHPRHELVPYAAVGGVTSQFVSPLGFARSAGGPSVSGGMRAATRLSGSLRATLQLGGGALIAGEPVPYALVGAGVAIER